eukprot:CAMPEP_0114554888 /NCGR_PEP_ID=MMETSP0114-20121206/8450_1 /TAXON_ID=31324 /ORGANISM="Goniomonas sp, Strain m" /LENGTH=136 /DNA_ID=CAMNT_0001739965 /DNA_START=19 /DNA_END=429 /DNA_ORIENTATION=+
MTNRVSVGLLVLLLAFASMECLAGPPPAAPAKPAPAAPAKPAPAAASAGAKPAASGAAPAAASGASAGAASSTSASSGGSSSSESESDRLDDVFGDDSIEHPEMTLVGVGFLVVLVLAAIYMHKKQEKENAYMSVA